LLFLPDILRIMAPNPIRVFEHAYYIGNYMSGILYGSFPAEIYIESILTSI
jgi:hypothetical protein